MSAERGRPDGAAHGIEQGAEEHEPPGGPPRAEAPPGAEVAPPDADVMAAGAGTPTPAPGRGDRDHRNDRADLAGPVRDDDGLGSRIRPYALTGGRTRSADDLPLETLVVRTAAGSAALPATTMERRKILDLCERPLSIAEISAYVGVHLGVARVLVGDMKGEGLLDVHQLRATGDRPDIKLLERVLHGLQAL